MPIRHRPDFQQALSTLQQLKEKEEEAQRNQRLAQSSFSWWSWQGVWWTLHSNESHHGDEPSTDGTGRPDVHVFGTILQGMIFLNSLCNQREGCKYYTSNDVFSRCKSVQKMATGKSDDELIQHTT